jgi:nucleoside-diphosphate-sugar epimerase
VSLSPARPAISVRPSSPNSSPPDTTWSASRDPTWPAGHTLDVGHLYRLALEDAPAGTRWHAAGDEGIPVREIAQSIGDHLGLPVASIPADRAEAHFGFLAAVLALDNPVTTRATRRTLGWEPAHPGLLADFETGDYFATPAPND